MDVYLAAPYAARRHVAGYASQLLQSGINVTSSWLAEDHAINEGTTGAATALDDQAVAEHASQDFCDIAAADTFVLITGKHVTAATGGAVTLDQTTSGGRHVETGYFIARRGAQNVIVVGTPENVFHRAEGVVTVASWQGAFMEIVSRLAQREVAPEAGAA